MLSSYQHGTSETYTPQEDLWLALSFVFASDAYHLHQIEIRTNQYFT